jgi:hypothetical protein
VAPADFEPRLVQGWLCRFLRLSASSRPRLSPAVRIVSACGLERGRGSSRFQQGTARKRDTGQVDMVCRQLWPAAWDVCGALYAVDGPMFPHLTRREWAPQAPFGSARQKWDLWKRMEKEERVDERSYQVPTYLFLIPDLTSCLVSVWALARWKDRSPRVDAEGRAAPTVNGRPAPCAPGRLAEGTQLLGRMREGKRPLTFSSGVLELPHGSG